MQNTRNFWAKSLSMDTSLRKLIEYNDVEYPVLVHKVFNKFLFLMLASQ